MATICNPNEEMSWPPVKVIIDGIDDLGASLNTPDYVELREDQRRPFKFDDVQRGITFYQAFDLAGLGDGTITKRYLSDDPYGDNPWEPSDIVLKNMAEDEDLFFVANPDGCICKTIFMVKKEGGNYTLSEISEMGCCQSLFVPEVGDIVPDGQNIVPTRPLASYIRRGNPIEGQQRYDGGICKKNSHGVGYKFLTSAKEAPLKTVARKFTGYLTWMARADYMATMWEKLDFILNCCRNGGSDSDTWWAEYLDPPGRRETECSPSLCEILKTLLHDGDISSSPGCLVEAGECVEPWEEPTCGGENCGGEGPKFYCETLNQMDEVIKKIESSVRPYEASGLVGCCCTPGSSSGEGADGQSTVCLAYRSDGLTEPPNPACWVKKLEIETTCTWKEREDPDDPDSPFSVSKSATVTDIFTWSGAIATGEDIYDCLLGDYDSTYEGDPLPNDQFDYTDYECTSSSTREFAEPPSAASLIAAAIADAVANGGPAASVAYAYTGPLLTWFGGETPCSPGTGYAGCYTYVIDLTPPTCDNHCSGGPYSAQTVAYDLVLYSGGVEHSRTPQTVSCPWDAGEGKFISSPQNYPPVSELTDYSYSIEFDESNNLQLCLEC